ncbi:MAG: TolC family protein [Bacteroidetes bacterium]|nr:TolC family protein [Bacteroidota bacterium]
MDRVVVVLFFLVASVSHTLAQISFGSVEDLWRFADEHNVDLLAGGLQRQVATASVKQAKNNFLPVVSVTSAFTDNIEIQPTLVPAELFGGPPGTYTEEKFGKRYNYNFGVNAQYDLLNLQNWFELRSAHYNESATNFGSEFNRQKIYNEISSAYFSYYLMSETEKFAFQNMQTSQQMEQHSRNLFREGIISEPTLNSAIIYRKTSSITLLNSRRNQETAMSRLKQLLNLDVADSIQLSARFEFVELDHDELQSLVQSVSANVKLAHAQLLSARSALDGANASFAPTLSLVYGYNQQITGNSFWSFTGTNNLPQQYWGLRLSIPVLSHGSRSFSVTRSRLDYETRKMNYESARRRASLEDQELVRNYTASMQKVATAKEIVDLYKKNDFHAARQLEDGQLSMDGRLRVFQEYLSYQGEYIHALSDFLTSYAALVVRQTTSK